MTKLSVEQAAEITRPCLLETMDRYSAIDAMLVVSVDGHMIANHMREEKPMRRLASMGSSLMSLGDTVTEELNMGACKNVVIENDLGHVVFRHVNKILVLVAVTQSPGGLGILLSASKSCAENVAKNFSALIS
ncbi:hypothetical protein E4634_14100 [Mangrovimicrobium sediminis]|uniref:Roadblock/LAMTOR2 domain-containing protein n=1 Tax=Mangrovimicrobium sediminis TaxID=2562682 RepID=A0A4Z0LZG1_9GAMM|nr:roadblock/LC7 domain-containing protein [Haliea sp. SAOS-164]TGD72651.1 hypothetical protein E4634_14100 [Haliea sp. SAOS-164]